tara:strand:+ start:535 stop:744 length:210 start_codon:yes stop_codon:yes gene_type:complete
MSLKKNSKLYAFDEAIEMSKPTNQMFTLKILLMNEEENVAIYKTYEEAETELIEYLKKGTCGWIVSNNE